MSRRKRKRVFGHERKPGSYARKLSKWLLPLVVGTFVVAIFQDTATAFGVAVRNTSSGLLSKLIDTCYIRAAQSEITDCATQFAMFASMTMVLVYVMVGGYSRGRLVGMRDAQLSDDLHDKRQVADNLKSSISHARVIYKTLVASAILFCVLYSYVVAINLISYQLLRDFNHSLRVAENVLSTEQRREIEGMWLRMRTKGDYLKIKEMIDEIMKKSDAAWNDRFSTND